MSVNPDDMYVRKVLRRGHSADALSWLSGAEEAGVGEMDRGDSLKLINRLLQMGAVRITAAEIKTNEPYQSSDVLIIELPQDRAARKRLYAWKHNHERRMGFEPTADTGQRYLVAFFD